MRQARARDRQSLLEALKEQGLAPATPASPDEPFSPELARAIHVYLARTSAILAAVQIEDLLGMVDPVNVPGTDQEYPNWQRKITQDIEQLGARLKDLDQSCCRHVPGHPPPPPPPPSAARGGGYRK